MEGTPVSEVRSEFSNDLAAHYKAYGRVQPEDEDEDELMEKSTESLAPSSATQAFKKVRTLKPGEFGFVDALNERNIFIKLQPDAVGEGIMDLVLARSSRKPSETEEKHWEADMSKCDVAYEEMFHRTIMMNLIDRHSLADILDYVCEVPWNCERMPRRRPVGSLETCKPKPDLAVAFKRSSLIGHLEFTVLNRLRTTMCPETAEDENDDRRAFHFFSLEAKKPDANRGETLASLQNLNTATQALHNIYVFMKIAEQEQVFFDDVRVFSIVASSQVFEVRMHRAMKIDKPRIEPDYPLAFAQDVVLKLTSPEHYKKAEVFHIVQNIFVEYGVKILHPILKDAVQKVFHKISNLDAPQPATRSDMGKRPAEDDLESLSSDKRRRLDGLVNGTQQISDDEE